jgi:hypothetical protein
VLDSTIDDPTRRSPATLVVLGVLLTLLTFPTLLRLVQFALR